MGEWLFYSAFCYRSAYGLQLNNNHAPYLLMMLKSLIHITEIKIYAISSSCSSPTGNRFKDIFFFMRK